MTDFSKLEEENVLVVKDSVVQERRFDVANLKKQLAEIQALLAEAEKLGMK